MFSQLILLSIRSWETHPKCFCVPQLSVIIIMSLKSLSAKPDKKSKHRSRAKRFAIIAKPACGQLTRRHEHDNYTWTKSFFVTSQLISIMPQIPTGRKVCDGQTVFHLIEFNWIGFILRRFRCSCGLGLWCIWEAVRDRRTEMSPLIIQLR